MENKNYEKNIIKQCFLDKEVFLYCMEKITDENIFSDEITKLYWQVFMMIYKDSQNICYSTINDVLKFTKNDHLIEDFENVVNTIYEDENEWKYHLFFIQEKHNKSILIDIAKSIYNNIAKKSAEEISIDINNYIKSINNSIVKSKSFKSAYLHTINEIKQIKEGIKRSYLITGHKEFDKLVTVSEKRLIMIASAKKVGKTAFTIDMMDGIVNNNDNVAIQWYCLEMTAQEMIRRFISKKTKLTDNQLMGRNYTLTNNEILEIETAYQYFEKYPVEFVDENVNIFNICSKFEIFKQKNASKHCICIIDNIGLISPHIKESIQYEDELARMFKNLRDQTSSTIIVLHHLTKESESKWNKDTGYEPTLTHVRGSSRLLDFSNQALLLHRPDHYHDLIDMAKSQGRLQEILGLFVVDVALNRSGETNKILFTHNLKYSSFSER